ncbi:MAG TPA: hypothetical protein P5525_11165 [Candidatus Paceibacterota bacterium]|nr:hypothetical protein [Candidatus Paceibacterota bacterium]
MQQILDKLAGERELKSADVQETEVEPAEPAVAAQILGPNVPDPQEPAEAAPEAQPDAEERPKRGPGRPSNLLKIAPPRPMPQRIDIIRQYHESAIASLAQGAMYALLCGFELHAARLTVEHGKWEGWVETHCPFSKITAWRYMQAAEKKLKDIPNLSRVKDFSLGVAPHALSQEDRESLISSVRNAVEGDTIRQLYLDIGLAKLPAPKGGHHPRSGAELTEAEKAELRKQAAAADWKAIELSLSRWVADHAWEHLDDMAVSRAKEVLKGALMLVP